MTLAKLEARLGHTFATPALLQRALTHRSHNAHHNERLEFLGDSVLNCVVAAMLFELYDELDEGDLSRVRANLVKQDALAGIARTLDLAQWLRLGEGELKSGGFRRPSILADAFEAVLGAVFLDAGFDAASRVIRTLYAPVLVSVDPLTLGKDAKTQLQEYLQGRRLPLPRYDVQAVRGAAHSQEFEVLCVVPELGVQAEGRGASRRNAEQEAACLVLERLQSSTSAPSGRGGKANRPRQLALPVAVTQRSGSAAASDSGAARSSATTPPGKSS